MFARSPTVHVTVQPVSVVSVQCCTGSYTSIGLHSAAAPQMKQLRRLRKQQESIRTAIFVVTYTGGRVGYVGAPLIKYRGWAI